MSDLLLNLGVDFSQPSGRAGPTNQKHKRFIKRRKFLERRGLLKEKQCPPRPNRPLPTNNSGQQINSWAQDKRKGQQGDTWNQFNRTNTTNSSTSCNGFHQQKAPVKQQGQPIQSSTRTVHFNSGPQPCRLATFTPKETSKDIFKGPSSSEPARVNGHTFYTKVPIFPGQPQDSVLSEFESGLPSLPSTTGPSHKAVAIDCEMVGTGPNGRNSDLARCSIVNWFGDVMYDKYIKPKSPVTDYRTRWSGIRREHLVNATPFDVAQKEILKILSGKVVIGHAIHNDYKALNYFHPKEMTRDTSKIPLLNRRAGFPEKEVASLKRLAKQLLHKDIQTGRQGHSSVEDAKTTMELYRVIEVEWERELAAGHVQQ
uniref:Exonuclease XPMC2 n=1 Tax=Xenopus laevis TaxID=8355 RepID=Q0P3T1_XENLA|nr:Unknown (protein for MGC:154192) [Xenopus laevis]